MYRYGFNGKEKDDEVTGTTGVTYDYGFRIYDSRIGKFLSVDPLTKDYPWYTPYQFAGNKPIWAIDLDGLEEQYFSKNFGSIEGKAVIKLSNTTTIGKNYLKTLKSQKTYDVYFYDSSEETGGATWEIKDMKAYNALHKFYRNQLDPKIIKKIFEAKKKLILIGINPQKDTYTLYKSCFKLVDGLKYFKEGLEGAAFTANEELYHATTIIKNKRFTVEAGSQDHKDLHGRDTWHDSPSKEDVQTKDEYKNYKAKQGADEIDKASPAIVKEIIEQKK